MENDDMATSGDDVTIYLVKKSVVEEGNREKKRRKQEYGVNFGPSLGEIHANSRKLRQCSKYFETCMSERWTSHSSTESSQVEFYLVVQTEMSYYEDCFSRMSCPFPKQIPSITHCIELLKVASQIQCQDVVDIGMKYLAAVPWSGDDEKQIRGFCNSGHFASNTACDLQARLDLLLTKEERHKKFSNLTKETLNQYLEFALADDPTCNSYSEVLDSRNLFEDAFDVIFSDLESGTCHDLQEYVMMLVQKESEKILISIRNDSQSEDVVGEEVLKFCWLYELSRRANVSQVIVEHILKIEVNLGITTVDDYKARSTWAEMIQCIFVDLLDGHLFLNTSQRYALFSSWNWILQEDYLDDYRHCTADLVKFITNIVETFPLLEQKRIYEDCKEFDGSILSQSRTTWLMHLIKEVIECGPESRALEGKDTSEDKI